MKTSKFLNLNKFFLCFFFGSAVGFDIKLMLNNETVNPLDFLIPTVFSENERCKNHSLLYREELSKFTVWATDMFDASSKFPTGMFIGSIYDTGNYDECVKVHLPKDIGFAGQHCMAHFKLEPLHLVQVEKGHVLEYDQYENIYNLTTWHKIAKYAQDASKQTRNELFFTFCLPSTCSSEDLEQSLKQSVAKVEHIIPFRLETKVNERNCQIEKKFNFTRGNISFMTIVGTFFLGGVFCTLYHLITKSEGMKKYQFTGKIHEMFLAFSFSHTLKKMGSQSKNIDGTDCMSGMKVITMFIVIMGHRMMFYVSSPLANPIFVEEKYRSLGWTALLNGPILVNSFFAISGFLASYLIFLEISKRKQMMNFGLIYLHRFLRLTPAYAVVIGFYCTIFFELGEGPFWNERVGVEQERCLKSWWANLLYINNYVNIEDICMFQSWYLTCDMHFYLLVPFLVYFLRKKPKIGLCILGTLIGLSVVVPFIIIVINKEEPILLPYIKLLRDPTVHHTFKTVHIPSHMRASSYLIGVLGGYLKFKIKISQYKIPKKLVYFGWSFGLIVAHFIYLSAFVFYIPTGNRDYFLAGLYGSTHHLIWGMGLVWAIIATSEGCGAWIAPVFNWRPFCILNRISYTAFLCHGAIQLYSAATTRAPLFSGFFGILSFSASDIVMAYVVGFMLSLVFEAPAITLEKIILGKSLNDTKKSIQNGGNKKSEPEEFADIYIPKIPKIPNYGIKLNSRIR